MRITKETKNVALTRQDLIDYAKYANAEKARLQSLPKDSRVGAKTSYCEVDQDGLVYWSSLMIGGKLVV